MKKLPILLFFSWLGLTAFSQTNKKEEVKKDGWNFGALPAVTFDTDLGFQYGALVNLYNYGDGSRYPKYNHSLYFEVSRFTKGSGIYRFYYDSDQLIQGLQTSVDLSYLTDQAYDFHGFNGYDAVFNDSWIDDESEDYVSRMFYKYDRKMFRFKVDLQGKLASNKFRWIAGMNLLNFEVAPVNLEKLNKGKNEEDLLPDVDGLYNHYLDWGLISAQEANGGFVPVFKGGLVFDTRDNKPHPMRGVWTEAVLVVSPKVLGAESSFSKLSLTHREYFTLIPKDLAFAYRLVYQTTLGGEVPFYYQSQVITSIMTGSTSEGLGGSKTLRGIRRNRVVGNGVFFGNAELRWKVARFQLINNNFYIGLNGFMDFGRVTKKIDLQINEDVFDEFSLTNNPDDYFKNDAEEMHISYGLGLRVAMNENFIIAIDYGMAADKRDGDSGLYMGLNYLF
ncbi:Omp85 family outer membrane protein [Sunxiuqinia sp. sy24]|uniref:Omp85 family outer membrane protein n=1 Tax=Sunxiuqinia sp. sy24 TaxID=3461495 RepID=UPI004045775E